MRTIGKWFLLAAILAVCYGVAVQGAIGTWRTSSLRGYLFSADRGTVTDSVLVLSTATLCSVQVLSGGVLDTVVVPLGGDTTVVITRRKHITGSNGTIWAYPAIYTGADTAGMGIACSYISASRNLWYMPGPAQGGSYNFYEVGGADSALAELQGVYVEGFTVPDSSVVRDAIEDYAINKAKVDTTAVVTYATAVAAKAPGKAGAPGYVDLHTAAQVDTLYGSSSANVIIGDRLQTGPTWIADSLGVLGDIWGRGDLLVGDAGTEILYADNFAPCVGSEVHLSGAPYIFGKTAGGTVAGAVGITSSDGYVITISSRTGMAAAKAFNFWNGPGTSNYIATSDGTGGAWSAGITITTLTTTGAMQFGDAAADTMKVTSAARFADAVKFQGAVQSGNAAADTLVSIGNARFQGTVKTQGTTQLGNASADTVKALGIVRVQPALQLGGNAVAGSMVWKDGSGNTYTETAPAMATNISISRRRLVAYGSYDYADVTTPYRKATYAANVLAGDTVKYWPQESYAVGTWDQDCVAYMVAVAKTDSVVFSTFVSSVGTTSGYQITMSWEVVR